MTFRFFPQPWFENTSWLLCASLLFACGDDSAGDDSGEPDDTSDSSSSDGSETGSEETGSDDNDAGSEGDEETGGSEDSEGGESDSDSGTSEGGETDSGSETSESESGEEGETPPDFPADGLVWRTVLVTLDGAPAPGVKVMQGGRNQSPWMTDEDGMVQVDFDVHVPGDNNFVMAAHHEARIGGLSVESS